ncbi:MAG: hypothetical protein GY874_01655 [Desulfobacteraceae bacterium]|nr:hypothetical protein [Desulfobacteraceae bacterium]
MAESIEQVKGYWNWTWSQSIAPWDSTISIAFSGWADPDKAITDSYRIKGELAGKKFISLGGGNKNGRFDANAIENIVTALNADKFSDYQGIAFDIEECEGGLAQKFHSAFETARKKYLNVLVTISHAAPYDCPDAKELMKAFFDDDCINYLSPQLYTNGKETKNDYSENKGVKWADYTKAKAQIIPSIVRASMFTDARDYFNKLDINLNGFVQWAQNS